VNGPREMVSTFNFLVGVVAGIGLTILSMLVVLWLWATIILRY
jgi:uncharacterized membrane protein